MEKCKNAFLSAYQKTVLIPREPSEPQFGHTAPQVDICFGVKYMPKYCYQ